MKYRGVAKGTWRAGSGENSRDQIHEEIKPGRKTEKMISVISIEFILKLSVLIFNETCCEIDFAENFMNNSNILLISLQITFWGTGF